MAKIKNIVFDFGCVLVDLDKDRCVDALNHIGANAISYYVDECRQEDLFHDLETGRITVEAFCDEVRRKSPGCKATNEEICWAWNQLLTGIPERRIQRLSALKEQYRLFLLSNTNSVHWDAFGEPISHLFERIFLSYKMRMVKPDIQIFNRLLEDSNIDADETLFIDDSKANCASAERLGIHTLHVSHGDEWLLHPLISASL